MPNKLIKYLIIGCVLLVIGGIVGVIITTNNIRENENKLKEIKLKQEQVEEDLIRIKKRYDSTALLRTGELKIRDSLYKVINKEIILRKYYQAEIKKVKGMYKNYSNDSLYNEIISRYENSNAADSSIN